MYLHHWVHVLMMIHPLYFIYIPTDKVQMIWHSIVVLPLSGGKMFQSTVTPMVLFVFCWNITSQTFVITVKEHVSVCVLLRSYHVTLASSLASQPAGATQRTWGLFISIIRVCCVESKQINVILTFWLKRRAGKKENWFIAIIFGFLFRLLVLQMRGRLHIRFRHL